MPIQTIAALPSRLREAALRALHVCTIRALPVAHTITEQNWSKLRPVANAIYKAHDWTDLDWHARNRYTP